MNTLTSRQQMNRTHVAMTDELEQGVGKILDQIAASGIESSTQRNHGLESVSPRGREIHA